MTSAWWTSRSIIAVSVTTAIIARSVDPGLVRARAFGLFVVLLAAMVPLVRLVPEDHGTR